MASIRDLEDSEIWKPSQKARIRRKFSQRKADLAETRLKISPRTDEIAQLDKEVYDKSRFKFKVSRGNQSVVGEGYYNPRRRRIGISSIVDDKLAERMGGDFQKIHEVSSGKSMDRRFVREALRAIAERYPKAERLAGLRETGARTGRIQEFPLERFRRAAEGLGKRTGKLSVLGTLMDYRDFQKQMRAAKKREKEFERAKKGGIIGGGSV